MWPCRRGYKPFVEALYDSGHESKETLNYLRERGVLCIETRSICGLEGLRKVCPMKQLKLTEMNWLIYEYVLE